MKALQFSVSVPQFITLKALGVLSRKAYYKGPLAAVKLVDIPGAAVEITGAVSHKPMMGANLLMGGFDRIYDTVGSPKTLNTAMRCLKAGGTISQVGIWHDVKLDLTPLWLKQQTLKGVYGCGYATYKDAWTHMFDIAIDLVQEGKVALDDMITHKFELDHFEDMIEVNLSKEKHRAIKTIVSFVTN